MMGYIWLGLAILFGIGELATTTMVSIWFMAGAVAALLVSMLFDSLVLQTIVFIAVSATTLYFTRPILAKKLLKKIPTNADMLIGKTATVTQRISPQSPGRVKVDGLTWRATANAELIEGEICTILQIQGATLIVDKQLVTQ